MTSRAILLLVSALLFCFGVLHVGAQRRSFRIRTPYRRITTQATTEAPTTPSTPVDEEEEEDEEDLQRGYSVDRAKTRFAERTLLTTRSGYHVTQSHSYANDILLFFGKIKF